MRPIGSIPLVLGVAVLLASCAPPRKPSSYSGFFKGFDNCHQQYEEMDARIDAAGVRDDSYYRVPGYPYLRTDRMLSSFRDEVRGLNEPSEWVRRMRELDQEARDYELTNLGLSDLEIATWRDRFLNCGRILAAIELDDPAGWKKLLGRVAPPDEYSGINRFLGLYLLRVASMRETLASNVEAERAAYLRPLPSSPSAAPLWLWHPKPVEDLDMVEHLDERVILNALGYPGLTGSEWQALAEFYAPRLWIETADDDDIPATPKLTRNGPDADPARPVVYYRIDFTRFGGRTMTQISYFVWFRSAPGSTTQPIDGLVWRVTFDEAFAPLTYESLHGSGRDHRWYPVQAMARRQPADATGEPEFVAPILAPAEDAAIRVAATTHQLRRVVPVAETGSPDAHEYELHPYEELYTLPRPGGGTRSLFGQDGIVAGTHGEDPLGGFASGIVQPGALRQYGHYAIAHVGQRHFDDPWLLESTFIAPPAKPRPKRFRLTLAGPLR